MTGNRGTEAEQLVDSADGADQATSNPDQGEGGWNQARRLELSVLSVSSGANDTATSPLIDTSFVPSAAGRGARSIPWFRAAGGQCTALYSGEPGLRGQ